MKRPLQAVLRVHRRGPSGRSCEQCRRDEQGYQKKQHFERDHLLTPKGGKKDPSLCCMGLMFHETLHYIAADHEWSG